MNYDSLFWFNPYFFLKGSVIIKILAYDQASGCTGVAVFIDEKLIKYDVIDLKRIKNDKDKRFKTMAVKIYEYIINEKPDIVVFEDVSLQTNVSTLLLLAQIQGVIMQSCIVNGIPYKIYKPTSWRKILNFAQGRNIVRKQLKQQAVDLVKDKYNINVKDDIADAICIGNAYIKEYLEGK